MTKRDDAKRELIFGMWLEGHSYAEISEMAGVTRQRVQQIVRPPLAVFEIVRKRADYKCEECGIHLASGDGHVHHLKTEGQTVDNFNDLDRLKYLCPSCHRHAHCNTEGEPMEPITIRSASLKQTIREMSKETGRSMSCITRELLEEALQARQTQGQEA